MFQDPRVRRAVHRRTAQRVEKVPVAFWTGSGAVGPAGRTIADGEESGVAGDVAVCAARLGSAAYLISKARRGRSGDRERERGVREGRLDESRKAR
jgi:hypothetical protein